MQEYKPLTPKEKVQATISVIGVLIFILCMIGTANNMADRRALYRPEVKARIEEQQFQDALKEMQRR